jgi:uncharacterized protein YqeY
MLTDKIFSDYKEAMKARDSLRASVLSFLRADMLNAAVSKKKDALDDSECVAVIRKQIKTRQDSIEQFQKGNRLDLAEKEAKELEILKPYLPAELPSQELNKIIEEVVSASGAQGIKDMGKVMKEVSLRVGQQADGRVVSELVKARLMK